MLQGTQRHRACSNCAPVSAALDKDVRDGDRYELVGELASGGMATVYLARMRRPMGFSRLVAVKCMHPQYAKDPAFASMFVDEARLTAGLRHPNIVPTLDIVADDGHLLLVMEYVEGATVAGLLKANHQAKRRIPTTARMPGRSRPLARRAAKPFY